jgi:O-succinylbenzoic acid--CoA ligase
VAAPRRTRVEDVQLIVSTSGSSGTPRGVMLSNANLVAAVQAARRRLGLDAASAWLCCLPLFHVGGLSILLRALEAGATVVLLDGFDADRVRSALEDHRVTHVSLVSPMLDALLACRRDAAPASLRVALLGGGPIDPGLVRRALARGWPVCPSYGLSENASQVATLCKPPAGWDGSDLGPPLDGLRVEIVDADGRPTAGPGRIRISGPTVMAGYVNAAGRTGDGLTGGGFTTTDLGWLDVRGHLHVAGRADDLIVSGGEQVAPQAVEAALRACPGITDIAVAGVPDATWGQRVVAVFSGRIDAQALEAWCREGLASPSRPRAFVRVQRLPRNAMGKLDRAALRALAERGHE